MSAAPKPTDVSAAIARKVPELTLHPLCTIIPPCTEDEFKELKKDIKDNGLQVPIKLFEGKILDGRSRYRACVELVEKEFHLVELRTEDFTRPASDALAYVISMNVKRRHLTASKRAMIAARLVTTTLGGDRSVKLPTEITQEKVATLSGVAVKMVTDAKKVLDNDPVLTEQVLNGQVAVAKAAKQVRDKEREAKGTPRRNKKSEADVAAEAYKALQEKLVDALTELKEVSSFAHAKEYAKGTKERLDETIAGMGTEDAEAA
jgi:ParB-like chromosome segregation protein Spo0J